MALSTTCASNHNNVLVSSARLVPLYGSTTVAHSTRERVLQLLEDAKAQKNTDETAMIVDISATTWNWDTYAIVAGKPVPIVLNYESEEELKKHLDLKEANDAMVVQQSVLVPEQPSGESARMVWVPKGSVLKSSKHMEFVLEAPVDPNNDRLEDWEQSVIGDQMLYKQRARLAHECMRNMVRFYNLDRIICWDLSWGVWEAKVVQGTANDDDAKENGFPRMTLLTEHDEESKQMPFPTSLDHTDDDGISSFYDFARPISPELLAATLESVSGYYLVGGNTYTMSLFHNMWDQQSHSNGHMQLVRDLLSQNRLCYLGHSAGAIMSGPNILTATFKGIDAFSIVTQPYNAPFLRLPPSETPETFFVQEHHKNDLYEARKQMLRKMEDYQAWSGYRVVEGLTFPHYDSRPRFASFPQSAETYLRATNQDGNFDQPEGSLLVGRSRDDRTEPPEVEKLRTDTNFQHLPCYPIANGHAVLFSHGGLEVVEALSPEEETEGILHWDTYMPNVSDPDYQQYAPGRTSFAKGSFTDDANTMAGDRSFKEPYNGSRIFSRLQFLGLPNPLQSCGKGKGNDAMFR